MLRKIMQWNPAGIRNRMGSQTVSDEDNAKVLSATSGHKSDHCLSK